MKKKLNKYVFWIPRILSTMFILFLMLFSLDVFDMKLNLWQTILGLFIHNIPAFILLAVLIISWKYEIVGGVAFILAGFLYLIMITRNQFEWYMLSYSFIIAGPAFLIGIMFLMNWFHKKK